MSKIVVLDPGHGGMDSGAIYGMMAEKHFNLSLALRIAADIKLFDPSITVEFTRITDSMVPLATRAVRANNLRASLYVSIHHNAGGGTGFESHIHPQASYIARDLQAELQRRIEYATSDFRTNLRKPKQSNFQVLRDTKMPALLIETLFIDNEQDILLITNPNWHCVVSHTIAEVIVNAK